MQRLLILLFLLSSCTDPFTPEFQPEESFILAEGSILAGSTESEIRLRQSDFNAARLSFIPITGATVLSVDSDGRSVVWGLFDSNLGSYRPPAEFVPAVGERWSFEITLADGTSIISDPETIPDSVSFNSIKIVFEQNSIFDEGRNDFIPRFELFADYDDPPSTPNFYSWEFFYWQEIDVCVSCVDAIWRNGECIPQSNRFILRYDYLCDSPRCYERVKRPNVVYSNDVLNDGQSVRDFPIGAIEFDRYGDILVVGQLRAVTEQAFEYGKVIEGLVSGAAQLNAVTPAPLNGNVRNLDPAGQQVLGYLGVATLTTSRALTERNSDLGTPLSFDPIIRLENPLTGEPRAPCSGPDKSPTAPLGWP